MTLIHTSDDLLKLLREDPAFYAEARRLILTDELIALPERFAALAQRLDQFIEQQQTFNEEQRVFNRRIEAAVSELQVFNEEQRVFNEEQRVFNRRIEATVGELQVFNEEQQVFNEEQRVFNEEQRVFNEEQRVFNEEQRVFNRRIEAAVSELRGDQAYRVCRDRVDEIAESYGFIVMDVIRGRPLRDLFRSNPPPNVAPGDRSSFYHADFILEVQDDQGATAYLAIEASYTGDETDTRRATRNAEYLTRITGAPAHAVVASRSNDRTVQQLVDDESIRWYQIPADAFQPE